MWVAKDSKTRSSRESRTNQLSTAAVKSLLPIYDENLIEGFYSRLHGALKVQNNNYDITKLHDCIYRQNRAIAHSSPPGKRNLFSHDIDGFFNQQIAISLSRSMKGRLQKIEYTHKNQVHETNAPYLENCSQFRLKSINFKTHTWSDECSREGRKES